MRFCSFSGTGLMSGPPNASFPHPIPQLTNYPPPPISPMSQFNSPPPLHLNLLQQTFPPPLQRAESSNSTKEASHLRVPTKSRHDQVVDHLVTEFAIGSKSYDALSKRKCDYGSSLWKSTYLLNLFPIFVKLTF